jgi:hypothetical protein
MKGAFLMPIPARNPIRVAAAAAVVLLATLGTPGRGSAATSAPTRPHSGRVQMTDSILPGLQVSGEENTSIGIGGTVLTNWVSISGDDGQDGTGSTWLLGPIQPAPGATDCTAITETQWDNGPGQESFTYSIDESTDAGNGRHWLSSVQMWRPGCYAWQHHIQLNPSGATADTSPAITGETVLIVQPQPTATINTARATAGSYLSDTLTLAGTYGRPVQITGQLIQAAPGYISRVPSCTGVTGQWDSPTVVVATISPFTVTGDGEHPVPGSYQATTAACYSFTFHLTVLVARVGTASADVPAGASGGTALVDTPTITTTASSTPIDTAAGTAQLSDALTVSGLHLQTGDIATVTAQILSAQPGTNGCADADWANADHTGTPTNLNVPADGQYDTAPVSAHAGCHTFVETLSINGHPVTTGAEQPGQQTETLLISPALPPRPTPTAPGSAAATGTPTPTTSSSITGTGTPTPTQTSPSTTSAAASVPAVNRTGRAQPPAPELASTGDTPTTALGAGLVALLGGAGLSWLGGRRPRRATRGAR